MPRILNVKRGESHAFSRYIGRGSPYGNPFVIGQDGDRAEVIAKFETYAREKLVNNPAWLDELRGRDLLCYCAPAPCHGDVIRKLLIERFGEEDA